MVSHSASNCRQRVEFLSKACLRAQLQEQKIETNFVLGMDLPFYITLDFQLGVPMEFKMDSIPFLLLLLLRRPLL